MVKWDGFIMDNTLLKRYDFLNRVYMKDRETNLFLKIFIIIVLIVMFLATGFKQIMEGKSVIIGILGFGGLSFYLVRHIFGLLKSDGGYKQVPVTVEFYSGKLILRYSNIDRQDRMGQRREEYTFYYGDLEGLYYSIPLQCLNIRGGPMLRVHFYDKSKDIERDYRKDQRYFQNLLYIPPENKDEFLEDIQKYSGINVLLKQ